ncbi:MAG: type IV secretion protein IcmL [Legionella sp.]|nr:MAG: type IV secretion protein IcmL [Legionella sp.]
MKKTMLWSAVFALIGSPLYADVNQTTNPSQPSVTNPGTTTVQAAPTKTDVVPINCDYHIPAQTKQVDQSVVITWSEQAALQAFDFDPNLIDSQLQKLKTCFTDQGWTSFDSALQKSGNVEAIKSQHLMVSSQVDGQVQVVESNNNQWKLTLPLQVVYQNDKEKVTQLLNINLTVGRKITGDLGIMQMVAAPRTVVTQQPSTTVDQNAVQTSTTTTPTPINNTTTTTPSNTTSTTNGDVTTKTTVTPSTTTTTVTPTTKDTTNTTTTVTPTTKDTTNTTTTVTPTNKDTTNTTTTVTPTTKDTTNTTTTVTPTTKDTTDTTTTVIPTTKGTTNTTTTVTPTQNGATTTPSTGTNNTNTSTPANGTTSTTTTPTNNGTVTTPNTAQ